MRMDGWMGRPLHEVSHFVTSLTLEIYYAHRLHMVENLFFFRTVACGPDLSCQNYLSSYGIVVAEVFHSMLLPPLFDTFLLKKTCA